MDGIEQEGEGNDEEIGENVVNDTEEVEDVNTEHEHELDQVVADEGGTTGQLYFSMGRMWHNVISQWQFSLNQANMGMQCNISLFSSQRGCVHYGAIMISHNIPLSTLEQQRKIMSWVFLHD